MTTSADLRPILDLPRLPDALAIDGETADWGDAGLRITAFAEDAAPAIAPARFAAEARLGWNARGLAVAVRLHSDQPWIESDATMDAFNADSVELFLRRGSAWKELVQPVIAPGMAPGRESPRSFVWDYRGKTEDWAGVATAVEIARTRQADGCTLEALIPWAQLRFIPALGADCEFALKLNKIISGTGRRQLVWNGPTGDMFQRLRLAETAAPAVGRAAWIVRDGSDRIAVCAVAPAANAGEPLVLRRGAAELVHTSLQAGEGRASACAFVLAPAPGDTPLTAELGGSTMAQLPTPDLAAEYRLLLEFAASAPRWWIDDPRVEGLRPRVPALLTGPRLPEAAMPDPALARAAGIVGLELRWFAADGAPVTTAERPGRYGAAITVRCATGEPLRFYQTCVRLPEQLPLAALADDVLHRLGASAAPDASAILARDRLGTRLADLLDRRETAELIAALQEAAADGKPPRPIARAHDWWHGVRTALGTATVYRWFRHLPPGYATQPEQRWPAVIYLHGSGGLVPRDYQPFEKRNPEADLLGWIKNKDLPLAVYALQASGAWEPPAVLAAIDRILAEDRIDPDRVVLMGFSMGGIGTWNCVVDHPERFAGAVPLGGRGYRSGDVSAIAGTVPVWAFNGDVDTATTLTDARLATDALKAAGGDVRLTVLTGAGHLTTQEEAFNTPGLWDWVLERKRVTSVKDSPY